MADILISFLIGKCHSFQKKKPAASGAYIQNTSVCDRKGFKSFKTLVKLPVQIDQFISVVMRFYWLKIVEVSQITFNDRIKWLMEHIGDFKKVH